MNSFPDGDWDLDYYNCLIGDVLSTDIYLSDNPSAGLENESSFTVTTTQEDRIKKRDHDDPCVSQRSKACCKKMRRDRMNKRFSELSMLLEPGKPVKTDKCAIMDDAIRVLNKLKAEVLWLKEANKNLEDDIKNLKEEKHELREEKTLLRSEKERMEEHVKALSIYTAGYIPSPPAPYHAGVSKLMAFPSYGAIPMWQWIPPAVHDISKDHELRPPMA